MDLGRGKRERQKEEKEVPEKKEKQVEEEEERKKQKKSEEERQEELNGQFLAGCREGTLEKVKETLKKCFTKNTKNQ